MCRILKSTYRTNETFFSRTHRFGCELQTSDAGWSSKVQKDNNCAAHVRNGMVYLTVPMDRLFAHSVEDATLDPRRRDLGINCERCINVGVLERLNFE